MTDGTQQIDTPALPSTPAEAATKLDQLKATPAWRDGFLAGQPEPLREYADLQTLIAKGDDVEAAMAGVMPDIPTSELRELAGTAEMLKFAGFTPKAIREVLSNQEAPQVDVDLATSWKAQAMKNPDFIKRWLGGDPDAAREMLAANAVLSLPLKKEGNT